MNQIEKCINDFLSYCEKEKNLSLLTLKAYSIDLSQFKKFTTTENISYMEDINHEILKKYISYLKENYKKKSIKRKIACLKSIYSYLITEDLISESPFWRINIKIQESKSLPKVLTLREINLILKSAYKNLAALSNTCHKYKTVLRDIAVLELLFATGLRVSEVSNLKFDNIDFYTGKISVIGKGTKERAIYIQNTEVLSILKNYYSLFKNEIIQENFFFLNNRNKRFSEQSIRFMVRNYARESKINKHITPHMFRHSFATLLLEEGVDIRYLQSFLGHSSISTTEIYTHVNSAIQKKILKNKHPRNSLSLK